MEIRKLPDGPEPKPHYNVSTSKIRAERRFLATHEFKALVAEEKNNKKKHQKSRRGRRS